MCGTMADRKQPPTPSSTINPVAYAFLQFPDHPPVMTENCRVCMEQLWNEIITAPLCLHLIHWCCLQGVFENKDEPTCPSCRSGSRPVGSGDDLTDSWQPDDMSHIFLLSEHKLSYYSLRWIRLEAWKRGGLKKISGNAFDHRGLCGFYKYDCCILSVFFGRRSCTCRSALECRTICIVRSSLIEAHNRFFFGCNLKTA